MEAATQTTIQQGLPEHFFTQAAALYYEAFRQKFEPIMRSQKHGVEILKTSFDAERAFVAINEDQLTGIAGLQYDGRQLINPKVSTFMQHFGWMKGLIKLMLFALFDRTPRKGELIMDGIVVHPDRRGEKIGSRLLRAVLDFARARGFATVRLDVVDTNTGARRLYEKMGFIATETQHYPYLRKIMGFSASTTLIKVLSDGMTEQTKACTPP